MKMSQRVWMAVTRPDPEWDRIHALLQSQGEVICHRWDDSRVETAETVYAIEREDRVAALRCRRCGDAPLPTGHPDVGWAGQDDLSADGRAEYGGHGVCGDMHDWPPYHGRVVVIDHHAPGDPGYGMGPEEFLPASSLGQVIAEMADLGIVPPEWEMRYSHSERHEVEWCEVRRDWAVVVQQGGKDMCVRTDSGALVCIGDQESTLAVIPLDLVLAAASDHCPAAAYRGLCPGVDPDALMRWRITQKAAFQGRPEAEILAEVERAIEVLQSAPRVDLRDPAHAAHTEDHDWTRSVCEGCAHDPVMVADTRGCHVPQLPEASLRLGISVLCQGLPDPDGRTKVNVLGDHEGHAVRAFLDGWAEANGIEDTYGDPARGFAGGYSR